MRVGVGVGGQFWEKLDLGLGIIRYCYFLRSEIQEVLRCLLGSSMI